MTAAPLEGFSNSLGSWPDKYAPIVEGYSVDGKCPLDRWPKVPESLGWVIAFRNE